MRRSLLLIALLMAPVAARTADHEDQKLDCTLCHACEFPSKADPCLKEGKCPRHEVTRELKADMGPDVVILDELEDLYVPVRFQHAAHARMVAMDKGCETCHHFTPPNSPHPACKECHPASVVHEDLEQPGLKGAYHRQCLGCHAEWDSQTKCEICHEKKKGGRLKGEATTVCQHSHYEPIEMKELILFHTDYDEGDVVPFHHRNHSEKYELNCSVCHKEQSCTRCHVQGADSHPMGELQTVNLHDTCYQCHGKQDCGECHGRDPNDLFDHVKTGWPLKPYHKKLHCRACHTEGQIYVPQNPDCATCHPQGWGDDFDHTVTGVTLNEVHGELACADCHVDGPGSEPDCSGCHDDGRSWDKRTGFGD